MAEWPREFEDLVLPYLPGLDAGKPLERDARLSLAGLDSTGMVSLMVDLESEFSFSFPEEEVTAQTFYSAGSLWSVVSRHART
jgi:acyl carrier protein